MIFLKWFDVQRQTLLGQGKVFVGKNQKVAELCPLICERMGWAPTTPLKLYEVSSKHSTHTLALFLLTYSPTTRKSKLA